VQAAVLERGGRAVLLPAPPGSGKSTLCAGLTFGGGWRLLSDEMALIEPATGHVVALPRPISLKNESIDALREFTSTAMFGDVVHEAVGDRVACVRPSAEDVLRADERAIPAWVVLPRFVPDTGAQLQPLSRARAFMALVDNAFNYNVHGRAGFDSLANVVDRSECHTLTYSSLQEAVAAFDQMARSATWDTQ